MKTQKYIKVKDIQEAKVIEIQYVQVDCRIQLTKSSNMPQARFITGKFIASFVRIPMKKCKIISRANIHLQFYILQISESQHYFQPFIFLQKMFNTYNIKYEHINSLYLNLLFFFLQYSLQKKKC